MASFCSLAASVFIAGCDDDFKPVYDVPAGYQHLVDAFINEAAIRGHTITINNLIINYQDMEAPHCAKCNSRSLDSDIQKIISFNPNLNCSFADEQFEALVFHELGHCILGREHDNSTLPNGELKSLMNQHDLGVYSSCVYAVGSDPCDLRFKRTYYLDELFDENAPVPDWGK